MSTIRFGVQQLRGFRQLAMPKWPKPQWQRPSTQVGSRKMSTELPEPPPSEAESQSPIPTRSGKPFEGVDHARPLPLSPSYFSRQPQFNDALVNLSTLLRRYQSLPLAPPDQVPRGLWRTLESYRQTSGEPVKAMQYGRALGLVKRLNQILPKMMPGEVKEALDDFRRDFDPFANVAKPIPIDRFGRALGVGRRKTSVARAWVVEGTGEVQINGKPLTEAFGRVHDRESVVWPLRSTARIDKYNVWALVNGGGTTGQAEALTLAIAKALMAHEPALKPALRRAGCVTRDPRTVERKKHGHLKARKMPAWVKR